MFSPCIAKGAFNAHLKRNPQFQHLAAHSWLGPCGSLRSGVYLCRGTRSPPKWCLVVAIKSAIPSRGIVFARMNVIPQVSPSCKEHSICGFWRVVAGLSDLLRRLAAILRGTWTPSAASRPRSSNAWSRHASHCFPERETVLQIFSTTYAFKHVDVELIWT